MTSAATLFSRLILRPLFREPVRNALTVFAVALGVGVVIAIHLAGEAAAGSFHSSIESLTGNSDFRLTQTGGLDEQLLRRLVQLPFAFEFTPRIEDFAFINGKGEALPLIGLDLISRDGVGSGGDIPSGDTIWVSKSLGPKSGDHVSLLVNDTLHSVTVAGILKTDSGVIVADIGLAQRLTGKTGKLDSIDVRAPHDGSIDRWRTVLEQNVPVSVRVAAVGARTEENQKMLAAFRWNLRVLSYIALIVGAFLIYNTISISVVRRRAEIGVARALGATSRMVAVAFVAEGIFFAATGSVAGIAIGRVMATGAVALIGNTVRSLYVSSQPAHIALTQGAVMTGIRLGLLVSILAALAPACEASRVAPVDAMARGREQYVAQLRSGRTFSVAVLLASAAAVLSRMPPIARQPVCAYLAVLLLITATALAIPQVVTGTAHAGNYAFEKLLGVEALLAMRSLRASVGRTSIIIAALATAVAMTASVGIMVGSFRETVAVWINEQLTADFYLRPAGLPAPDRHPMISADTADRIERLPGVAAAGRFRAYPISYEGLPATLAGGEASRTGNAPTTRFLPGENTQAILAKLPTGDFAIVSEPFANKHNVRVGSTIALPLGETRRRFEVLGIYYDYSTERGVVVLDRRTLLKYLPDRAVSNIAVYLKPGADPRQVRRGIDGVISAHAITVSSNAGLRRGAMQVFDRTFRITYAVEAVAVAVAVMGIAGVLLAMVLDRRREFALLRFLGGAQTQIRRIILCEAGLIGLLANGIGLILGTLLSLILIFVINKQSFGWTIQFHWPVALLLGALTGVYVATVLAGLYPARIATRLNPIDVIHEE
ncbi:MAG: ABC transporter permease [Acidobacteriaceae bacterium]|nr:ABC transporter permease [Acidobacteriaceae bacterium]